MDFDLAVNYFPRDRSYRISKKKNDVSLILEPPFYRSQNIFYPSKLIDYLFSLFFQFNLTHFRVESNYSLIRVLQRAKERKKERKILQREGEEEGNTFERKFVQEIVRVR